MVICKRLYRWFRPSREQAGKQLKRGCTDSARKEENNNLFVFIDFSCQGIHVHYSGHADAWGAEWLC